jgi:hypothetical protein
MLCRSINLFVNLLVQLSPCLNKNSLQRFNTFANLFIAFNGFVNFFLFAAFGQRFREMVLYIFFRHGQYPFMANIDGMSMYRPTPGGITPIIDPSRRQSKPLLATDNDVWSAIARRRSSASMAVLYNPSDNRSRPVSRSNTNSSQHLHIPTFLKETSNIPRRLSSDSDQITLTVPNNTKKDSSLNSIKTRTIEDGINTPTFRVSYV